MIRPSTREQGYKFISANTVVISFDEEIQVNFPLSQFVQERQHFLLKKHCRDNRSLHAMVVGFTREKNDHLSGQQK
jgi:hypothetical protein